MKYLHSLDVWQMRDGRKYARLVNRFTGDSRFYELSSTGSLDVILCRAVGSERGEQLEIEFSEDLAESSRGSLFPE